MFTNNERLKETVHHLLENKYSVDLIEIQVTNGELVFNGKGYIFQDNFGQLKLKLFSDVSYDQDERLEFMFGGVVRNPEGEKVSEYYKLLAKDENLETYKAEHLTRISILDNITIYSIRSPLKCSRTLERNTRVVFSGNYSLPINKYAGVKTTLVESFNYSENMEVWEVRVDEGLTLVFSKFEGYLDLMIIPSDEYQIDEDLINMISYSLNFVLGLETEVVYINLLEKGHTVFNRRNLLLAKSTFSPPLIANHHYGIEFTTNHTTLFKAYLSYLRKNSQNNLPIIHKRIVSGSRNYIFAAALLLSVQIENICKDYYVNFYIPDDDFYIQLESAIKLLESSGVGHDKIIGNLKSKRLSKSRNGIGVANVLNNLASTRVISKKFIISWKLLRNLTAHGDEIKRGWEDFLASYYDCTNLYYQLIFNLIGYVGKYSYKDYANGNSLEHYPIVLPLIEEQSIGNI
ncbi:hypothetical protein [Pedobacter sp. UYP1]|uniref:hypothetical protein n=1 Tax=Pedobacter sp. UYP1 TaxID=1756396 RepID=UPI003391053D